MIIGNITITAKEAKAMRNALYIAHANALINLKWAKGNCKLRLNPHNSEAFLNNMKSTELKTLFCKHCGKRIHNEPAPDTSACWVDETGGDVCGWDGGNEPHAPEKAIEREQDTVEALDKIRKLCSLIENDAI